MVNFYSLRVTVRERRTPHIASRNLTARMSQTIDAASAVQGKNQLGADVESKLFVELMRDLQHYNGVVCHKRYHHSHFR